MRSCCMLLMDTTPIIFLAKIDKLDLLLNFDLPIFMPREVYFELTEKRVFEQGGAQSAEELSIKLFIDGQCDRNRMRVVTTIVCEATALQRERDPSYRSKGDGEVAANSLFLNRDKHGIRGPALLLYEDSDMELLFRREDVHFLTTYAMLVSMEKLDCLESADKEWSRLSEIYEQKNREPLEKRNIDISARGDTEYISRIKPPGKR